MTTTHPCPTCGATLEPSGPSAINTNGDPVAPHWCARCHVEHIAPPPDADDTAEPRHVRGVVEPGDHSNGTVFTLHLQRLRGESIGMVDDAEAYTLQPDEQLTIRGARVRRGSDSQVVAIGADHEPVAVHVAGFSPGTPAHRELRVTLPAGVAPKLRASTAEFCSGEISCTLHLCEAAR